MSEHTKTPQPYSRRQFLKGSAGAIAAALAASAIPGLRVTAASTASGGKLEGSIGVSGRWLPKTAAGRGNLGYFYPTSLKHRKSLEEMAIYGIVSCVTHFYRSFTRFGYFRSAQASGQVL